jgi:membrane protease YdiL (CAAX protease family)
VSAITVDAPARPRERLGLEVIGVLGVSLGMSAIYALLSLIRTQLTVPGGIGHAQITVVSRSISLPWLDLAQACADILNGVMPAFLALVLLARTPGGAGFGVGWDARRLGRDILYGAGFCALIGIPGLALLWLGRHFGFNAEIAAVDFPAIWYRVPVLLLDAFQNGLLEEVVVVAYLLTRLRQIGWTNSRALTASAVLRGSYHLYQGFGGFAGNMVMGLVFGYWFQRTRRVIPLIVAHFLLDAFSFVGYIYLKPHISWL